MFNWNKSSRDVSGKVHVSMNHVKNYFGVMWLKSKLLVVLAIYLLITIFVGWYWSQEPDFFSVPEHTQQAAQKAQRTVSTGYTTVETLKHVASTLLDKPGGYLTNDMITPSLFMDNIPSWEYGVLVQVRDLSRALRKDFARSQTQSTEDVDLAKAEPRFNFDNNSWALPATEDEYRAGIKFLDSYLKRLSDPERSNTQFYARADNLNNWLGDVTTRLGSLSQRLSASIGKARLNIDVDQDGNSLTDSDGRREAEEEIVKTPWLQIDNVFYEARGQAWALSHFLRAIEIDFADVISKKNATVSVRQIIRELEASQESVWSPMILNGSGYGILANHSLIMANYISRANSAIIELRQLLSQG